jgi:aminopeptidase N
MVLSITARHADSQTLDRLVELLRVTKDPLGKELIWLSLLGIADPAGAQRVLNLSLGPDVPAGTQPYMPMAVSRDHPDLAWKFTTEHVDRPGFPVDSQVRLFMMPMIASNSNELQRIKDLEEYADAHIPSSARRSVEDAVETIKLNSRFREQRLPDIDRWLAGVTTR